MWIQLHVPCLKTLTIPLMDEAGESEDEDSDEMMETDSDREPSDMEIQNFAKSVIQKPGWLCIMAVEKLLNLNRWRMTKLHSQIA